LFTFGKILVGGDFTSIGGQTRNRIARLEAPGCSVTSTVCGRIIEGTAPTDFMVNLSDPQTQPLSKRVISRLMEPRRTTISSLMVTYT
jgi:hypothetical protein